MFEDLEYRHYAKISRDAWYLKIWCWAWMSEPENADFCKLFWGFVFLPLNLFIRITAFPFWLLFRGIRAVLLWIDAKLPEREEEHMTHQEYMAKMKKEREEEEARLQKHLRRKKEREAAISAFFGRIGMVADRIVGAFQTAWPVIRWVFYLVGLVLALALAGALVWGMTMLVPLIADNLWPIAQVVLFMLGVVLALVLGITILGGTGYFFTETNKGLETRRMVKSGGSTFLHAMYVGLCAVKTRTCPKVELIEEESK